MLISIHQKNLTIYPFCERNSKRKTIYYSLFIHLVKKETKKIERARVYARLDVHGWVENSTGGKGTVEVDGKGRFLTYFPKAL